MYRSGLTIFSHAAFMFRHDEYVRQVFCYLLNQEDCFDNLGDRCSNAWKVSLIIFDVYIKVQVKAKSKETLNYSSSLFLGKMEGNTSLHLNKKNKKKTGLTLLQLKIQGNRDNNL